MNFFSRGYEKTDVKDTIIIYFLKEIIAINLKLIRVMKFDRIRCFF